MFLSQHEVPTKQVDETYPEGGVLRLPLTIVMVVYAFYESDTRVMQYAEALARRGDSVEVFALRRGSSVPAEEMIRGVKVFRIQKRTVNERGALKHLGRLLLFTVRATILLYRGCRRRHYDLIHVHNIPDFLVFSAVVPKLLGTPIILDIHDLLPELYASKFRAAPHSTIFRAMLLVERFSTSFATHVVVANHLWCRRLAERSAGPHKCSVIRNRPDLSVFGPVNAAPRSRSSNRFLLTYPGTLNDHQGVDVAIRAFASVARYMPDAEFHIYGEGSAKTALIALVKTLEMTDRIFFHNFLPATEIARIMAHTDLAIEPKRSKSPFGNEALSTKILEFMALGVPVIASRTTIHGFYYDDSIVQYYDDDDECALAHQMLRYRQDPVLRSAMARRALKFAQSNTWDACKHEYLELVDTLVHSRATSRKSRRDR
jgi:glycosyltransferase involved in cell wall biosynthesis